MERVVNIVPTREMVEAGAMALHRLSGGQGELNQITKLAAIACFQDMVMASPKPPNAA